MGVAASTRVEDIVCLNAATRSNILSNIQSLGGTNDLVIFVPAALPGAVTVQLSWLRNPTTADADWRDAYLNGAAVTLVAGMAMVIPIGAIVSLRLKLAVGFGSDTSIPVVIQEEMN